MLREYKFKILYTLGKNNSKANALSYRRNLVEKKTINKFIVLEVNNNKLLKLL